MSNGIARLIIPLFFSITLFAHTQTGLQYFSENTYRNTAGALFQRDQALNEQWKWIASGTLGFSASDWEFLSFAHQFDFLLSKCVSLSTRLSHRIHLPEPFSRTTLLFLGRFETVPLWGIGLFGSVGWYKRFVHLQNAKVLPVFFESSFTEHDFAVELGFNTQILQNWELLTKLSTFDETESYNINNPYVEASLIYKNDATSRWMATARYQVLLGFGRLDRLAFCLSYLWNFAA